VEELPRRLRELAERNHKKEVKRQLREQRLQEKKERKEKKRLEKMNESEEKSSEEEESELEADGEPENVSSHFRLANARLRRMERVEWKALLNLLLNTSIKF
jgi:hypothetical protein